MKKSTNFELDADIRPALKKEAIKLGQDVDRYTNDLLRKTLSLPEVYNEYDDYIIKLEKAGIDPVFFVWASKTLPLQEKFYKTEYYNLFIEKNSYFKDFLTQKRFATWIGQYAIKEGLNILHGKSKKGRWTLLYSNTNEK